MSISRAGGFSLISLASSIRSSVVSPRALTTTTTWLPACLARMARRAAAMMRSALATLDPPNFCTTTAMDVLFSGAEKSHRMGREWGDERRPGIDRPAGFSVTRPKGRAYTAPRKSP